MLPLAGGSFAPLAALPLHPMSAFTTRSGWDPTARDAVVRTMINP
jgi:hypothetical protein